MTYIAKPGGKTYHQQLIWAHETVCNQSGEFEEVTRNQIKKRGLEKCKKCFKDSK